MVPDPPGIVSAPVAKMSAESPEKFEWRNAMRQAWLYTGVMHSFRFVTEPGTRDTLNGPWFNDWMSSVSEIRGWDDGDPFVTDYVAHSMEGAIFGFIQQQNDPRYREVAWGSGRDYWISRPCLVVRSGDEYTMEDRACKRSFTR